MPYCRFLVKFFAALICLKSVLAVVKGSYKGYQASDIRIHHVLFHQCFPTPPECLKARVLGQESKKIGITDISTTGFTAQVTALAKRNIEIEWQIETEYYPLDCKSALEETKKSQLYKLSTNQTSCTPVLVYCDYTAISEEWTVIHRRFDGSVNFLRNWQEYVDGFGDKNGEFWLGLKNIEQLTASGGTALKVRVVDVLGVTHETNFKYFRFLPSAADVNRYEMRAWYQYPFGSTIQIISSRFVTVDTDIDNFAQDHGAWWLFFGVPLAGNLNTNIFSEMTWKSVEGPLKEATMMIKNVS